MIEESEVDEVVIEEGDLKITVRKAGVGAGGRSRAGAGRSGGAGRAGGRRRGRQRLPPGASPSGWPRSTARPRRSRRSFVEVGDEVEAGQTLCILEMMKMMNELTADVGRRGPPDPRRERRDRAVRPAALRHRTRLRRRRTTQRGGGRSESQAGASRRRLPAVPDARSPTSPWPSSSRASGCARGTRRTSSPSRPSPACCETRDDIDALLEAHAKDWPLDRIAPLERSILRLALWEIAERRDAARGGHRRGRAPRQAVLHRRGRRRSSTACSAASCAPSGEGDDGASGRAAMPDGAKAGRRADAGAGAGAPASEILGQLEELEPRLAASSSAEVEMTLLERATEQVEEAGRLLEQLGRVAG